MDITLIPTKLNGTITARPSLTYSLLHAACQAMACHRAKTGNSAPLEANTASAKDFRRLPGCWSEDLEAVLDCFESLAEDAPTLMVGENAHAFCLMLPMAAAVKHKVSFAASAEFPNSLVLSASDVLKRRGVAFSRGGLKLKRRDRGRLHEVCTLAKRLEYGSFSLTGREDPYFVAGLLMALPLLEGNSSIRMTTMPETTELPDMTVSVLKQYGITVLRSVDDYGYPQFEIPGNQVYRIPDTAGIEGDWTRAAFWLGCGALGGNVTVRGLSADSKQVARQIQDKLHSLGAATGITSDSAAVVSGRLTGCNINAGRIPQLVPILSVIMAHAEGTSMLTGIDCDAYSNVFRVLDAFDADISDGGSGFSFTGRAILTGGEIDSGGDPVMVMTAVAASCICRLPVTIRNAGVVNKKYPDFFREYEALGGRIER